jgi:ComF family protein
MNPRRLLARCTLAAQRLLPQDCFLCGAPSGGESVCPGCARDLPLQGETCPQCALPSPGGLVCGRCLAATPDYDATVAPFRYEFPVDRLIQALKYQGRLSLVPWLAHAIAERAASSASPDLIVPMPLHRDRLRERGFNQSVEIARALQRETGALLAIEAVRRTRPTQPQVELPLDARAKNVRGAFACTTRFHGQHVAVVDDVMTSGATLDELARMLKAAGAARVTNWVIARTVQHA